MLDNLVGKAQVNMPLSVGNEGTESFAETGLLEVMSKWHFAPS